MKDVLIKYRGEEFEVGLIDEKHYFQSDKKGSPSYAPIYDERAIEYLGARLKRRTVNRYDNRVVTAGPPRTGKTTLTANWARTIDPDFPVENVAFRLSDYKKILSSLRPADPEHGYYPMSVLDESGVDLYAKDWATLWVKDMAKVFQIVGKKRLTMFMNLPHRNLLAKDMRDAMHFWANTVADEEYRGFAEIREACPSIWFAPYWKPLFGVIFNEVTGKWWQDYESAKDDFIEDFTKQPAQEIPERVQRLTAQRDASIKLARRLGASQRDLVEVTSLEQTTISGILRNSPAKAETANQRPRRRVGLNAHTGSTGPEGR